MKAKLKRLISLLSVLVWSCTAAADAGDDAPYPVWWSPSLELESLDRIDERLERKFWPDQSEGMPVVKGEWPGDTEAFIDSCASYDKLRNEEYYTLSNQDDKVLMFQSSFCYAIEKLPSARPSRASYVNDVTLNPDIFDYLPAMVNPAGSCDFLCRQYVANERRIPWRKFEVSEIESVDVVDPYKMDVKTTTELLTLEILARGDFNQDGLEDLLIRVTANVIEGTWGTTEVYTLTRDTPDGVLWLLDAEKYICPVDTYTCDQTYDYPDALRETD